MKVLVTGAGGFVGAYLVEHLLAAGDEVLATKLAHENGPAGAVNTALDITSSKDCLGLLGSYRPEVIYHLAGISFVPEAENDFSKALLVNVAGTSNLVRACHLLQLGTTFIYISSSEVYGKIRALDLPLSELTPVSPANNYSLSKLMAEMVVKRYQEAGFVRGICVRPFNHIGPGQDVRFVASSFAHQLASIARNKVAAVIKVGNLEAERDFTDVRDMVRAYRLVAQGGMDLYNLGSGLYVSIQYILDTLIKISGLKVVIEQDPERMRASEVPRIVCDYSKAKRELGWEPQIKLEDTLELIYRDVFNRVG